MSELTFTNAHYLWALSLIDKAKDTKYSVIERLQYLDDADLRLDIALQDQGGNHAFEVVKEKVTETRACIKNLRKELQNGSEKT